MMVINMIKKDAYEREKAKTGSARPDVGPALAGQQLFTQYAIAHRYRDTWWLRPL